MVTRLLCSYLRRRQLNHLLNPNERPTDGDCRQQQDSQCPSAPLVSAKKQRIFGVKGVNPISLSEDNDRLPRLVADGKT